MSDPQPTTPSDAPASGAPLLQVEHVSKQFGGVRALDNVKFDVMTGEVLCLAGENGCGKSTLIKIITGVYQPEPGAEMRFQGRPIEGLSPAIARDLGIQVIWQDLALFAELSVLENIGFERNPGARAPRGGREWTTSASSGTLGLGPGWSPIAPCAPAPSES